MYDLNSWIFFLQAQYHEKPEKTRKRLFEVCDGKKWMVEQDSAHKSTCKICHPKKFCKLSTSKNPKKEENDYSKIAMAKNGQQNHIEQKK